MYWRVATASALVPLAFAILGLAAWMTGRLQLASLRAELIPMAPATAAAFVLVSAALIAVASGTGTAARTVARVVAGVLFTFAAMGFLAFAGVASVGDWEAAIIGQAGTFGAVPLGRMSPLTATTFALVGLALACPTGARSRAVRDLGGVLGSLTLLMGSTVALGYAYGAPLLYGGAVIPMALSTGIAFMGTGVALIALAGPASLPLRPFSRGALRAARADTERKRAEKALHESEVLARTLVEHLPQRIFVKDRNSQYVFCNPVYARDLGIEPGQIAGQDDFAFFPRNLAEAYRAEDRAVMADATIRDRDEQYERAGKARWIHTTKVPYRDERGEIIGVLGVFEDITERKRAEAEHEHFNDEIQLQRLRVFKATVRTVQDIVNNLLNGLQLAHLEGEAQERGEAQALVDQVIQEAAVKLRLLGDLEMVKEKETAMGLGIDYPGASS
jgi:PAS domain S-box-containing protein